MKYKYLMIVLKYFSKCTQLRPDMINSILEIKLQMEVKLQCYSPGPELNHQLNTEKTR